MQQNTAYYCDKRMTFFVNKRNMLKFWNVLEQSLEYVLEKHNLYKVKQIIFAKTNCEYRIICNVSFTEQPQLSNTGKILNVSNALNYGLSFDCFLIHKPTKQVIKTRQYYFSEII